MALSKQQLWQLQAEVNAKVSMANLVRQYFGVTLVPDTSCLCPFHDDRRRSAKAFANSLVCFAETRTYRPWDVLTDKLGWTPEKIQQQYRAVLSAPVQPGLQEAHKLDLALFFQLREVAKFQEFSVVTMLDLWVNFVRECQTQKGVAP